MDQKSERERVQSKELTNDRSTSVVPERRRERGSRNLTLTTQPTTLFVDSVREDALLSSFCDPLGLELKDPPRGRMWTPKEGNRGKWRFRPRWNGRGVEDRV